MTLEKISPSVTILLDQDTFVRKYRSWQCNKQPGQQTAETGADRGGQRKDQSAGKEYAGGQNR